VYFPWLTIICWFWSKLYIVKFSLKIGQSFHTTPKVQQSFHTISKVQQSFHAISKIGHSFHTTPKVQQSFTRFQKLSGFVHLFRNWKNSACLVVLWILTAHLNPLSLQFLFFCPNLNVVLWVVSTTLLLSIEELVTPCQRNLESKAIVSPLQTTNERLRYGKLICPPLNSEVGITTHKWWSLWSRCSFLTGVVLIIAKENRSKGRIVSSNFWSFFEVLGKSRATALLILF